MTPLPSVPALPNAQHPLVQALPSPQNPSFHGFQFSSYSLGGQVECGSGTVNSFLMCILGLWEQSNTHLLIYNNRCLCPQSSRGQASSRVCGARKSETGKEKKEIERPLDPAYPGKEPGLWEEKVALVGGYGSRGGCSCLDSAACFSLSSSGPGASITESRLSLVEYRPWKLLGSSTNGTCRSVMGGWREI